MIYNNIQNKLQLDPCIICGASLREHTVVKLEIKEKAKFDFDAPFVSKTIIQSNHTMQLWISGQPNRERERKKERNQETLEVLRPDGLEVFSH